MPAARYWRAISVEAHAGGDLELSALHVYDAGGRVDIGATLTSTMAPAAGALANLQDSDFGTTARFAAAAMSAPAFALQWDFGSPVDVHGVRAGGRSAPEFLKSLTLQYSSDGVTWGEFAAQLGDFIYPGADALTATPASPMWIYSAPGDWIEHGPAGSRDWEDVAVSADGQKMLAAVYGGNLWISTDAGATWTAQTAAGSRNWWGVAMSADGQKMLAGAYGGNLWISTDAGATWAAQTSAGVRNWGVVAMTADGQKMLAGVYTTGNLWLSTDAGATWTAQTAAGSRTWWGVAMSADGQKMLAGVYGGGGLYASTDGGATWVNRTSAGVRDWRAVTMSADGQKMLAAAGSGAYLWVSTDAGATWVEQTAAGSRAWRGAAMDADGRKMLASAQNGNLWMSTDTGVTWIAQSLAGVRNWRGTAISANGRKMFAGSYTSNLVAATFRDPMFADPPLRTVEANTPDFFASSPTPDFTTIKLADGMPWRDMEFAGNGKVTGTVKEKNTPANTPLRRRVRLVREIDGLQIRETWSDASTGAYEFLQIDERHKYSVISYDYMANYRAVIADSLTPEIMT